MFKVMITSTQRVGLKIFCVNYDITKQVFVFVFGTQKGSNNIHFEEAYCYLLSKQSQQLVTMHIIDQFAMKNIILIFAIFLIINAVYLTKKSRIPQKRS